MLCVWVLRVRARCPNSDGALVPGAFANVDLVLRSVPDALTVPSIAVIPELGGKKVFVYEDGTAQPRPVETGIRSDTAVQITSGLVEGDVVIASGADPQDMVYSKTPIIRSANVTVL